MAPPGAARHPFNNNKVGHCSALFIQEVDTGAAIVRREPAILYFFSANAVAKGVLKNYLATGLT